MSLKFEVLADWGGLPIFPYKTFVEMAVGRQMAILASKLEIDAVLALGDNFYLEGVKDVDDPRFKVLRVFSLFGSFLIMQIFIITFFNYQSIGFFPLTVDYHFRFFKYMTLLSNNLSLYT